VNNTTNLDYSQTVAVKCEQCNGIYFEQVVHLRKASRLLTGTEKDAFIPVPVFACKSCGHVNEEFLPKEASRVE